jgi:predicted ABC-type ATPase
MNGPVKKIIVIAGPNGAGKTTFAEEFLLGEANCPDFINADLIARGLSPFAPETAVIQAARIMLAQMSRKVARGESFAFETTLAGRNYIRHIRHWQNAGYYVKLVFLSLPTAEVAVARVRSRVAQGGHNVPEGIIRRRFDAGLKNFRQIYSPLVDGWMLYENSGPSPVLLFAHEN